MCTSKSTFSKTNTRTASEHQHGRMKKSLHLSSPKPLQDTQVNHVLSRCLPYQSVMRHAYSLGQCFNPKGSAVYFSSLTKLVYMNFGTLLWSLLPSTTSSSPPRRLRACFALGTLRRVLYASLRCSRAGESSLRRVRSFPS